MAFYVGQRVQAVIPEGRRSRAILRHGSIYTVAGYGQRAPCPLSKKIERGVLLAEQPNSQGFTPNALRAVNDRPTDISIFKAMLAPKSEQVSA